MSQFERMLHNPNEQFDRRSELLASIEAYAKATPAAAPGNPTHDCVPSGPAWDDAAPDEWICSACGRVWKKYVLGDPEFYEA